MNTLNLVQASAKIVQVTELTKGDVYKRLEESSYSEPELKYGVVYDVLFNGEEAVIQAIEYKVGYNSVDTQLKTFATTKDLKLFSCTPEEVVEHLKDAKENMEQRVVSAEKSLTEAIENRDKVNDIVSGELARKLSSPKTEVKELSN